MAGMSIDYDLMYELARQVWHLRDEMDINSKSERTFAHSDIGPRNQTADALTDFYGDWRKSFGQAWDVLTDLGNLLDDIGKAFYDADAGIASSAAQQAASFHRAQAKNDIHAYEQRMDAKRKRVQADAVRRRYLFQEIRLEKQRDELEKRRAALEKKQEGLDSRQQQLNEKKAALEKEQEPLLKRQEELQEKQQALWRAQLAERDRQEAAFKTEQDAQDAKFKALEREQAPLQKRQEELEEKQRALWSEESDLRQKQDAAFAAQQASLQREQDGYDAKQNALEKRQQGLWEERNALLRKKGATQAEWDAWQKKQDDLTAQQDTLWKLEGEPLQQKWDDLQKEQQEQEKAFEPLRKRQQDLDREQQALIKDQEPLVQRQEKLIEEQRVLGNEQDAERKKLADEQQRQQDDLDAQRDGLSREQSRLQPQWGDLEKQQEELQKERDAGDDVQKQLDKDQEAQDQQEGELQQRKADDLEEVQNKKPWTPESGEPDPLYVRRDMDENPETAPAPVPKALRQETKEGTTEVTYKLDQNGEIEVDKDGNPIETTTTITDKRTGMVYSETFRHLPGDGDSLTTTRSADGSVTKVYVDSNAPNHPPGYTQRWVTDDKGNTLQIWGKDPDGEWQLKMDRDTYFDRETGTGREDDQQFLDKPPAYLTVDKPLVNGGGNPDGDSSPGTTTTLPDGNTRTDYTRPDGSALKVVETPTNRYVADGSTNEIQEIWAKKPDGTWYLSDSVTQHERYGDEPPLGTLGINWQ